MYQINCNGRLVSLDTPQIMGVLNVTPDSFFDGGHYKTDKDFLLQVEKMITEGATFIDVGGASSKPKAIQISEKEELNRIEGVVQKISQNFPEALISIDTSKSIVAQKAVEAGASIINDISSGLADYTMLQMVAQLRVPYIMMHMRGTPQTMMEHTQYDDLIKDVTIYFSERIQEARQLGISDIILDVGFGFSKTISQNFELMKQLNVIDSLFQLPLLTGISRKSMIHKTLGCTPQEALNGTTALHMIALQNGTKILRVHDVKEAKECVDLYLKLK